MVALLPHPVGPITRMVVVMGNSAPTHGLRLWRLGQAVTGCHDAALPRELGRPSAHVLTTGAEPTPYLLLLPSFRV